MKVWSRDIAVSLGNPTAKENRVRTGCRIGMIVHELRSRRATMDDDILARCSVSPVNVPYPDTTRCVIPEIRINPHLRIRAFATFSVAYYKCTYTSSGG